MNQQKQLAMKLYQKRSTVLRTAHQIRKATGCTFGQAQRLAWAHLREENPMFAQMTFEKVSGEVSTRIVYLGSVSDFIQIKGTGSPLPSSRRAYVDLAKFWAGSKNPVISVYSDKILNVQPYC